MARNFIKADSPTKALTEALHLKTLRNPRIRALLVEAAQMGLPPEQSLDGLLLQSEQNARDVQRRILGRSQDDPRVKKRGVVRARFYFAYVS